MAFSGNRELYAAVEQDVLRYVPVPVAELVTGPASCASGVEHGTDATFECELKGEVNPWGVSGTEVWFEWGRTAALGERTPAVPIATGNALVPVPPAVISVPPNTTIFYRVAGEDQNAKAPEELTSETVSFTTPIVPPRVVGTPSASFVKPFSAVLFGELNPENAQTEYYFQYYPVGKCNGFEAGCRYLSETAHEESSVYGKIGATLEAKELQPGTTYHYRLVAKSEGGEATGAEGTFTTAAISTPTASTGAASGVGSTSAILSGTVDPDGQPTGYYFEYGTSTDYGIGALGSVDSGAGSGAQSESFTLTGLQPGTTYYYRIVATNGYGTSYGADMTFTTVGLPAVLESPPVLGMLPVPAIKFPPELKAKVTPRPLSSAQKLAKALKACHAGASKARRASCEKRARKKFAAKSSRRSSK